MTETVTQPMDATLASRALLANSPRNLVRLGEKTADQAHPPCQQIMEEGSRASPEGREGWLA